jgi:hypothetical protein
MVADRVESKQYITACWPKDSRILAMGRRSGIDTTGGTLELQ